MAHHGRSGPKAIPAGNSTRAPARSKAGTQTTKSARGRTAQTNNPDGNGPDATEGKVLQERLTEASRPIGRGGGKMRGDRQDTHPDPGRRNNERSGLRNDRHPNTAAGRRNNKSPNQGG